MELLMRRKRTESILIWNRRQLCWKNKKSLFTGNSFFTEFIVWTKSSRMSAVGWFTERVLLLEKRKKLIKSTEGKFRKIKPSPSAYTLCFHHHLNNTSNASSMTLSEK
jgi:hypothetical protein